MIGRTVCFSSVGQLSLKLNQLVWDSADGAHATMPIEDLGFVILESDRIDVSAAAMRCLSEHNVALIVCDASHAPLSQLVPFAANSTAKETMEAQFAATEAVQGRIWRAICRQKILNQAALMTFLRKDDNVLSMKILAEQMKNGDPSNCEGQAARMYFHALGPDGFRRDPDGAWPNAALNYGYAILRAALARAIVGSGLSGWRGVHHHNRYNAFCLADDLIEPYRPFVDQYVFSGVRPFDVPATELTREMKARLLQVMTCDVSLGDKRRPLMVALSYTTASLAKYYLGVEKSLALPVFGA